MKPWLVALVLPVLVFGCAANDDETSASTKSNLDTSGCSGVDSSESKGPVKVSATKPPKASCWNVDDSGLTVVYSWTQTNDPTPEKTSVGFYVALNGGDDFQKADATECHDASEGGLGHDTSGDRNFTCTATKRFAFRNEPKLKAAAYGADDHRVPWEVQVAVALDDGQWDSLGGANYRFSL
jgi:hypothetical protein